MKKIIGGLLVLLLGSCTLVFSGYTQVETPAVYQEIVPSINSFSQVESTSTWFATRPQYFPHRMMGWDAGHGYFIHRQNRDHQPDERFEGSIFVQRGSIQDDQIRFSAWREVAGRWVETDLISIIGVQATSAREAFVTYSFRKSIPAGRYGIRARAMEGFRDGNGDWRYRYLMEQDWTGTWGYVESMYVILYADSFNRITVTNSTGNSRHDLRNSGNIVTVFARTNNGAMNMQALPVETQIAGNYNVGRLHHTGEILVENMVITVERNGSVVSGFDYIRLNDRIIVIAPGGLSNSRYIVRFSHPANLSVQGEFIMDNTTGAAYSPGNLRVMVPVFLVLGILAAVLGTFLFGYPKVKVALQERRYRALENARYLQSEEAMDEHHYTSQSAKNAYKHAKEKTHEDMSGPTQRKSRTRGFLDAMRESKAKREIARDAGLTMEEFREIEAKHKKVEDAKAGGLAAFRKAIDEHTVVPEVVQNKTPPPKREGDEFELLDSVAAESITTTDDIREEVVQPSVEGAVSGSILSRLRNLTGEDED